MPRKKSKTLTDGELRIMEVLWACGTASVKDVTERLAETDQPVAYNTVLTMLRILAQKGYVDHHKQGRAFIYQPVVNRAQARKRVLDDLLGRFFNNSPALLVQNLLDREDVDADELARLKRRIAQSQEER